MFEFSSFQPVYLGIYFVCLIGFYLIGELLVSNQWHGSLKVAARVFLGMLTTISGAATFTFGAGSMLFPLFLLMLFLMVNKFYFERGAYQLKFSLKGFLAIILWSGLLFVYHAYFSNMDLGTDAYVPNTDFSYYAGMGHELFGLNAESLTSDPWIFANPTKTFYHYPDLYLSGVISSLFNIIPFYAYSIIAAPLLILSISLLLFSFAKTFLLDNWKSALLVGVVLVFLGLPNFLNALGIEAALLDLFPYSFPALAAKPYALMGGMILLGYQWLELKFKPIFVFCFLGLSALANPGIALVFPMVFGLLIGFKLLSILIKKSKWWSLSEVPFAHLALGFVISCIPYLVYGVIDGRMNSPSNELNLSELIYLVLHTNVRYYLSMLMLGPIILGIWYWWKKRQSPVSLMIFVQTITLGVGFSVAFSMLQGNTIQMFIMGMMYLLIPFLVLGLIKLVDFTSIKGKLWSVFLGLVVIQSIYSVIQSDLYQGHLDWQYFLTEEKLESHLDRNTMYKSELAALIKATEDKSLAYYKLSITEETELSPTMPHYHDFIFFKGLQPSCDFYALNALDVDFEKSNEMEAIIQSSVLHNYKQQYPSDYVNAYLSDLKPDGIICYSHKLAQVPDHIKQKSLSKETFGRYTILWFLPS